MASLSSKLSQRMRKADSENSETLANIVKVAEDEQLLESVTDRQDEQLTKRVTDPEDEQPSKRVTDSEEKQPSKRMTESEDEQPSKRGTESEDEQPSKRGTDPEEERPSKRVKITEEEHSSGASDSEHESNASDSDHEGEELVKFETGIGKPAEMYVTTEVREELVKLQQQTETGKPPTVAQLKVFTTAALQLLLKYNDRPSYNCTKPELAQMIADYIKNGCPPRCPKCNVGFLKFSNGKKKSGKRYYWCPGSTKNGRNFYGCNFRAAKDEIQRIPWKIP